MLTAQERLKYYEEKQNLDRTKTKEEIEAKKFEEEKNEIKEYMDECKENASRRQKKFNEFCNNIKKSLLTECICIIFEKSCGIEGGDNADTLRYNIVTNFLNEHNASDIIRYMSTQSIALSEMADTINKYYNIIVEENMNSPEFTIDTDTKANFYDELNMDDIEDMSSTIKMRVAAELNEFINDNKKEKIQIKAIANNVKDSMENDEDEEEKSDEIKEAYQILGKKWITNLKTLRNKNILECMIHNVIESTIKRDDLKKVYIKEGVLDMDAIVESCTLIYTFLETLNTSKIFKVDEKYIIETLNSLKV